MDNEERYDYCLDDATEAFWSSEAAKVGDDYIKDMNEFVHDVFTIVANHKEKAAKEKDKVRRSILNQNMIRGLQSLFEGEFKHWIESNAQDRYDNPNDYYGGYRDEY
jgi:hypothetical protein